MQSREPERPTVYFDKSALGECDIVAMSSKFEVCYSEALLLDLKSDRSEREIYKLELDELNAAGASFLCRDGERVVKRLVDSHDAFAKASLFDVDAMHEMYLFLNGAGSKSLRAVATDQFEVCIHELGKQDKAAADRLAELAASGLTEVSDFDPTDWWRTLQRETKTWRQNPEADLDLIFRRFPELVEDFPSEVIGFDNLLLAAMLLGILGLGQDRGIHSPKDESSRKAARNGYIDCLHIAYGMHCDVFLTKDRAAARRFKVLSKHYGLEKACCLI